MFRYTLFSSLSTQRYELEMPLETVFKTCLLSHPSRMECIDNNHFIPSFIANWHSRWAFPFPDACAYVMFAPYPPYIRLHLIWRPFAKPLPAYKNTYSDFYSFPALVDINPMYRYTYRTHTRKIHHIYIYIYIVASGIKNTSRENSILQLFVL